MIYEDMAQLYAYIVSRVIIFHLQKDNVFPFYHYCELLFQKECHLSPGSYGNVPKYNELFLSANLLTVYESTNLTIHLPFCGEWYGGNKIYTIQKCRLLNNVTPCSLLCSYLLHTHLQAGSHKEDDSMCLGPQVDTNGCNLACGSELVHAHPLNNTMRNDHPS